MPQSLPAPGEFVWIRQARWRVERARRLRTVVRLDVSNRLRHCTFLAPFDRWSALPSIRRPRFVRPRRALAIIAGQVARQTSIRTPVAAIAADIAILPYQLEPALAVASGARRVLIADEVGLGKTIQAGLAIAGLVRLNPSTRVLVVAPAALLDQWQAELAGRFQIASTCADAETLTRMTRAGTRGDNAWRRSGVWIASPDYLKQPHVLTGVLDERWDLVAIDEAHGVSGPSERHRACHALARRSLRVVLMSATPHSGDEPSFARLLNLGRLEGVDDAVAVFRRTRDGAGFAHARRIRWRRVHPSAGETRVLDALLRFERAVLQAAGPRRHEAALLLLSVLRKRACSTMGALVSSIDRRLVWLDSPERVGAEPDWLQPRLAFDEQSDEIGDAETAALHADIGLDSGHERSWLRRLERLARDAERQDSKVRRIARLVERSRERVIIFTEFRHSLDVVRRAIERNRRVSVLHGGLTAAERRQALEQFLAGGATALVATDVASQGLNLQMGARWVINLELPWNPARLEQRVGRVDRIGQTRPVHVTLLVTDHEAESGVLARLARRALSARRALGGDVFDVAVPGEAHLRAAILMGASLDSDVDDGPPSDRRGLLICRRWERPARFVAKRLARARQLAARWREPSNQGRRPAWTTGVHAGAVKRIAEGSLLVFSASIVDRSGSAIEQRLVAVHVPAGLAAIRRSRVLIEEARQTAVRRLSGRVSRLRRLLNARHEREAACTEAIDEVLAGARRAALPQPGLFHGRLEQANDGREHAAREQTGRTDELEDIRIGPVTLSVVIADKP